MSTRYIHVCAHHQCNLNNYVSMSFRADTADAIDTEYNTKDFAKHSSENL